MGREEEGRLKKIVEGRAEWRSNDMIILREESF